MARTNTRAPSVPAPRTHEGAIAARIKPIAELRRTVMCCLLWEDNFYESGQSVAQRITDLVAVTKPDEVAALAIEAREKMKLRHVPLKLARELVRNGYNVESLLERIIQRPDELTEFLAIYWKDGKTPVAASVKRGLAKAFQKFNAYSLAKYNRADAIKLRDVLFLVHAKPKDDEQAAVWKQLVDGTLPAPDTWEVTLSAGKGEGKREAWERLLSEKKLGALALLRNLRNMTQADVEPMLIREALAQCNPERVLPFRFVSAAKHAPRYEPELETLMFKCLADKPKLPGRTVLLIDGSGSMFGFGGFPGYGRMAGGGLSERSELERFDSAAALAMLLREVCVDVQVAVFSNHCNVVPPRRGFALRDVLMGAAERGGTNTEDAKRMADLLGYDRLIIVTDEQSHQALSTPRGKGYVVNVATYQHGVGYGAWTHIDGWSEAILDYITAVEG